MELREQAEVKKRFSSTIVRNDIITESNGESQSHKKANNSLDLCLEVSNMDRMNSNAVIYDSHGRRSGFSFMEKRKRKRGLKGVDFISPTAATAVFTLFLFTVGDTTWLQGTGASVGMIRGRGGL